MSDYSPPVRDQLIHGSILGDFMSSKTIYHKSNGKLTKPGNNETGLSDREKLFVREYLIDLNQTAAARRVGIKNPLKTGNEMFKLPRVQKELAKLRDARTDRLELVADSVLQELAYSVYRDPMDLCDPKTGQLIVNDMRQIPKRMRSCIEGIEVESFTDAETGNVRQKMKIKLTSKLGATELAMKHLGLLAPVEHNVKHSLDWEQMYQDNSTKTMLTPAEEKIAQVKALVDNSNVVDAEYSKV